MSKKSKTPPNYHVGEPKPGIDYDAGKLMDRMRPQVEKILREVHFGLGELPTCQSQSLRAKCAVEIMPLLTREKCKGQPHEHIRWFRLRSKLQLFLAAHQVVSFLENEPRVEQQYFVGGKVVSKYEYEHRTSL